MSVLLILIITTLIILCHCIILLTGLLLEPRLEDDDIHEVALERASQWVSVSHYVRRRCIRENRFSVPISPASVQCAKRPSLKYK